MGLTDASSHVSLIATPASDPDQMTENVTCVGSGIVALMSTLPDAYKETGVTSGNRLGVSALSPRATEVEDRFLHPTPASDRTNELGLQLPGRLPAVVEISSGSGPASARSGTAGGT